MAPKRPLSASSPPPTTPSHPKTKKSKANQQQHPLARSAFSPEGSSPPYNNGSNAQSPVANRSRSRSRSMTVVPVGNVKGKGKARQQEQEEEVEQRGGVEGEGDGADLDGEDEELDYSDDEFGAKQKANTRQKEDLRILLEHFDPIQMDRYESYRRSGLNKGNIRKLVNSVLSQAVSTSVLTVVRGFAKVYVGEIVEKARSVAKHSGPLTPADLREAQRLYLAEHEGSKGGGSTRKKMFIK